LPSQSAVSLYAFVRLRRAWNSKETVDSISALRSNRVKLHNSKNGGSVRVERKWQRRWSVAAVLVVTSMIGPRLAMTAREKTVKSLTADFEQSTAFQEWRVVSGAESSAARATLTPGPGHSGRGAILQYEIPCNSGSDCREAVAAQWTPRSAMPVARHTTVSLWIRFAPNVAVSVECEDSSEHTAESTAPAASLEHPRLAE